MTDPTSRLTLRGLPLAAKLVLSVFLIAVGLGYSSALVQLHMKHSDRAGEALPTLDDVVERFSGLKTPDPSAPPPVSRIQSLLAGDRNEPDVGKTNMAPAFFAKSRGYARECEERGQAPVNAEREAELLALIEWCNADPAARKTAYDADQFKLPENRKGKPITEPFADADRPAVKIKTLIDARCQTCHKDQAPSLGNYAELEPLVTPPSQELIDGKWVRSPKQITVEALTQSTHAHLLSFAVLFTLTGLIFAFTTFPTAIRCIVAPIVLLAQMLDVGCWWLARIPGSGPYFAQTIVFTGGIVGTFLGLQIVLSLFNMYGKLGKAVLLLLFLGAAVAFATLGVKVIQPALQEEREATARTKTNGNGHQTQTNNGQQQSSGSPQSSPTISKLERLIMGPIDDPNVKWNGSEKGSMAAAFFHKDGEDYKSLIKDRPKAEVDAEREGERKAVRAWIVTEPAPRKAAYEADKFNLPAELASVVITPEFRHDDKAVKVKTILERRCVRCHTKDGSDKAADYPLETYEQVLKYIEDGKK